MLLEGLLVDLVPFGKRFEDHEHTWYNSPGVFYWAVGGRWIRTKTQIEQDRRWREEHLEHTRNQIIFGVQAKDETPLGLFGINHMMPFSRVATLTAFIGEPDYWGGGYGTDALLLLADYAFDWLDLRKIWLMTMSLNARVLRQMEKVGFTLEANQRQAARANRAWVDIPVYGLLREEWPGRAAMIEQLGLEAR